MCDCCNHFTDLVKLGLEFMVDSNIIYEFFKFLYIEKIVPKFISKDNLLIK